MFQACNASAVALSSQLLRRQDDYEGPYESDAYSDRGYDDYTEEEHIAATIIQCMVSQDPTLPRASFCSTPSPLECLPQMAMHVRNRPTRLTHPF